MCGRVVGMASFSCGPLRELLLEGSSPDAETSELVIRGQGARRELPDQIVPPPGTDSGARDQLHGLSPFRCC